MYLVGDKIEKGVLRQGDVVSEIHLFGAISLNSIHYSAPATNPDNYSGWAINTSPKYGDAMVLSHSCEISLKNRVKVTSIILAPIRDINTATDKSKIAELIESNCIDRDNPQASFLKYFYLDPNLNLQYSSGAIVDFSKIFSLRKNSYDDLLTKKVLQLSDEDVSNMSLKLALYFHRKDINN